MRNIKIIVEYEGTNYYGWQKQPKGPTIQEAIENALENITGENIFLFGSGRTDSGVHARGQVANFKTESKIKAAELQMGLNSVLPKDITIKNAQEVDLDFHAQHSAKSKTYIYKVFISPHPSALLRKRAWYIPHPLELDQMRQSAEHLIGEHDFKAFAQSGAEVKTTVRTVLSVGIEQINKDILEFNIEATGFLKRMVRLIVGTMAQVGKGRITPLDFSEILDSGEKTKLVYAAPAHGLYLENVRY